MQGAVSSDGINWAFLGQIASVAGRNAFFPAASVAPNGMVALTFLYSLLVLVQFAIVGRSLPQGLTMVVLLLLALTGMLMLAIGTLGVYIFRIFQEVLARPRYLVDETLNVGATETHGRS